MTDRLNIPALRVQQWLPEWDDVDFDAERSRRKPEPFFFQFSLAAAKLKRLTGVHKRTAEAGVSRSEDLSTQRLHQPDRSHEISEFVRYGFPWSELSERQRVENYPDLRKPGWLPTTILLNILLEDDERDGRSVHADDRILIENGGPGVATLNLPDASNRWEPTNGGLHPFEVIDGQHRLWAFEEEEFPDTFELPVVAFSGLDRSWQAYLFWSINIKPKRINASLAYDLYPLLRAEEWLERFSGPFVYRETRAQELVEALWAHPLSPWRNRINMLGEPGTKQVRQAAWIRSLVATFVRSFEGPNIKIGGLFGAYPKEHQPVVPWTRPQQAAFLIRAWAGLSAAIEEQRPEWALALQEEFGDAEPMMFTPSSLLNTDQGVRAFLAVLNDLTVLRADTLSLADWHVDEIGDTSEFRDVSRALESLDEHEALSSHLALLATAAAGFDWRSASAPGLDEEARTIRLTFRGGGGYRLLRFAVLRFLRDADEPVAAVAAQALDILDVDDTS